MGSFKANGREQGPNRRRAQKQAKRRNSPRLEWLENRLLLTGGDGGNPVWKPSSTNLADVQNGPMANLGGDLINVYETYIHNGGDASKLPAKFPLMQFKGSSVYIGVNDGGGDFNAFTTALTNLGMQISAHQRVVRAGRRLHADHAIAGGRRDAADHERPSAPQTGVQFSGLGE